MSHEPLDNSSSILPLINCFSIFNTKGPVRLNNNEKREDILVENISFLNACYRTKIQPRKVSEL